MGTGAQVGELALLIERNVGILRQIVDQLHLVGLALLLHELQRPRRGAAQTLQLQLFLADLPHFGLDFLQVLGGEGLLGVQIIIETVVDGGADSQLRLGPQALDGLGHHMGAGVPIGLAVFLVFKGVQFSSDMWGSSFFD